MTVDTPLDMFAGRTGFIGDLFILIPVRSPAELGGAVRLYSGCIR